MDLFILHHGGIQHTAHQAFGERIRNPHVKQQVRLFAIVDDIKHLLAERKHAIGVAEHQFSQLAGLNAPPLTLEQLAL